MVSHWPKPTYAAVGHWFGTQHNTNVVLRTILLETGFKKSQIRCHHTSNTIVKHQLTIYLPYGINIGYSTHSTLRAGCRTSIGTGAAPLKKIEPLLEEVVHLLHEVVLRIIGHLLHEVVVTFLEVEVVIESRER